MSEADEEKNKLSSGATDNQSLDENVPKETVNESRGELSLNEIDEEELGEKFQKDVVREQFEPELDVVRVEESRDKGSSMIDSWTAKPLPERLPRPTFWPAALSLAVTLVAFGVVTSWIISLVGLALFVVSATGWFMELRYEQLQ